MSLELDATGSYKHPDDPGEPTTGHPRLSVTGLEASILTALVRDMTVAEIGTGLGVSTRALAASAARVHTVDVDPWVQATIWPTLPDNACVHASVDSVPRVDAVFIDGDHSTGGTLADLEVARMLARKLIVVHDVNYDTVRAALDGEWHTISTVHGLGVQWI